MELGKTRKVRGGHKAYANKVISGANQLCEQYDGSPSQKEHLIGLKSSQTEKLETIRKLDEHVLETIKEEDIEKEIAESGEFFETLYRSLAKIETCLCESTQSSNGNGGKTPKQSSMQKPKLPKLSLKEFTGNPEHWQTFWDCFDTAIYKNDQLSEIDKFNYLKGCLRGSAASAIDGIALTNENFKLAIDILKERFANPQLLISSHMDSLLKLSSVSDIDQLSKLRDLYDKIEIKVRSLNSLGVKSETYGNLLTRIIMNKIPSELRLVISRKFDKDKLWDIGEILKAIKTELEARERCVSMKVSADKTENNVKNNVASSIKGTAKPHHAGEFTSSALLAGKSLGIYCSFCQGQHPSAKCNVYTDPTSRKTVLRQKSKCYVCLRAGHIATRCRSSRACPICAGKHHVALCDKKEKKVDDACPQRERKSEEIQGKPQEKSGSPTSSNICTNSKASMLLQTAVAPVGRPDNPQLKVNARLILDSGSQRSRHNQLERVLEPQEHQN
jgi:hypothetical protein